MIKATFETPNFNFEAYGNTEQECNILLKKAWEKHACEYHAHQDYFEQYKCDVSYETIHTGLVNRDREELLCESKPVDIALKTQVTSEDKPSWIAIVYEAIGELGIDFDEPSQDELNTAMAWLAEECGVEDIVDFLEERGL